MDPGGPRGFYWNPLGARATLVSEASVAEAVNMKRAYHDTSNVFASSHAAASAQEPELQEASYTDQGVELRKFLWTSYLSNKKVDATFLAELAWRITKAGGRGVEDIGSNPKFNHGHDHVKLLLGRDFKDPELHYVSAPMFNKITSERVNVDIPMHMPSAIFKDVFESHVEPTCEEPVLEELDCSKWRDNPVRKRHEKVHWSRIVPTALYWDGVQYTIRDSFFGLYIRDLRSSVSHLVVLVR
jgi:hypothetical protein